jgi:hypothetical protein
MNIEEARSLTEQLKLKFDPSRLWNINDWVAKTPKTDLDQLKAIAEFAKKQNPASANEIQMQLDKVKKTISKCKLDTEQSEEARKFMKQADTQRAPSTDFPTEFDIATDTLIDGVCQLAKDEKELRQHAQQLLKMLSNLLSKK